MSEVGRPGSTALPYLGSPALWVLLGAGLLAARAPDAWLTPQLWAEDGPLLLRGALTDPLGSIVTAQAGYLVLLPRLLALGALAVPLEWVPALYAALAFAVAVAAMAMVATAPMPARTWPAAALAFAVVPLSGEVPFSLTNVQWITGAALAAQIAAPPATSATRRGVDLMFALLAGLSGPFALLYLPAVAIRIWLGPPDRHTSRLGVVVATCAAAQLACLVMLGHSTVDAPAAWPGWTTIGAFLRDSLWLDWFGLPVADGGLWPLIALALMGLALAEGAARSTAAVATLIAAGSTVVAAVLFKFSGMPAELLALTPQGNGARYFYIPGVVTLWLLLLSLPTPRPVARVAALALVLLMLWNGRETWPRPPRPDLDWAGQIEAIRRGGEPRMRIHPIGAAFKLPPEVVD